MNSERLLRLQDYTMGGSPTAIIGSLVELRDALTQFTRKEPGVVHLESEQGNELLLGIGGQFMTAQFTAAGGDGPYLCARAQEIRAKQDVEFNCGGTGTPFPPELCLSIEEGFKIADHFFETGERTPVVDWVEI